MSWASDVMETVRNVTDGAGAASSNLLPKSWRGGYRKGFRYAAASQGGAMSQQYEYSREKGMNSDEAVKNASTGGYQYSQARGMQGARHAAEEQAVADQVFAKKQAAEAERARGQIAARVRRSGRSRPSDKNGTLLTGSLGVPGSSGGTFAQMLGL